MLSRLLAEQRGAAAVEYALLASMVAVSIVAVLLSLGHGVDGKFREVDHQVHHRIQVGA
jgi:Flp pilus assembly pilin Flp